MGPAKSFFVSSLLASTVFTVGAIAQDKSDDSDEIFVVGKVLYTDQVNALKAPTPIIDVPQSLSILTADEINKRGFSSIGEIITYTPGVNTSQGEGHRDAIVFRGVRSTADFYIDGVRDDVQYYRPLYNLAQVEILRGPNALLFGRGGTGGILNRVTKKGVIGENFTGYQASVDTFGAAEIQFDTNYSTNDRVAFRLNGMYEYLNNHRDFFDGNRFGINPTAKINLTSSTTLDLSYEYVDHERLVDRGIPTGSDGRPVDALQDITFGDPENNFTTLQAHLLRATVQHKFSETLKGNFSVFYGDYDKVYTNFLANAYDPTTNIVELDGYIDTTARQNLILSGTLVGEFSIGKMDHTIITGGEYINTSSDQNRFNSFFDTAAADAARAGSGRTDREDFFAGRPINLRNNVGILADGRRTINNFTTDLNDDTRVGIDVFSIYIQDQVSVTNWLDLVAGIRFDSFDIQVNNLGDPANPDLRDRTDQEFSPRFGIILKPRENISIYASFSESFLPRSGEQFANINGSNNQLDPNTFQNLEAGVKWDLKQGMSLTAALFEIEQSSPQVADADPSTLDIIDSEIQGIEVQLQGQVTGGWLVSAGYSYLDGEQINRSGPTGLRPRELPENTFSIWNNFQATSKLGLGIGVTYQDESFVNNSNTAILPSYVRVDAAVYYDMTNKIRLQINLENLTDEVYFPNAHSTHQVSVGAPINARFAINGQF